MKKAAKQILIICLYISVLKVSADDAMVKMHPVASAQQKLEEKMMAKRREMRFGNFEIGGSVVSEQGEALEGVSLSLAICMEKGIKKEERVVDKTFKLNYEKVSAVHMILTKPGFYVEERSFTTRLMKENSFVVELVEIGQPVALQEYDGFISFCPTGMSVVVDFTSSEEMLKSLLTLDLVSKKDNLPKLGMCILADTNETNAFELQSWRDTHVPRGVRLQSLSAEDGFIPFECLEQNPARADRRMRIAPELGYESAILVPPSDKRFYFYCKIAGRYGKGYVSPVTRVSTGNKIETPFRILLQSEKSNDRNVTGSR